MGSRKESERTKFIQDKCQTLLTTMLRDEDNKYCVDCDAKGPRWASWNLGIFLCIRCAGIHRNLGVHISRVKSVNLDSWTPEQVVSLQNMGNSKARAVYEAQLPDGFRRPQVDSALESFIRAKYEHKKYMAREWVPTPPAKANWDKEIDEEIEHQKRKKKTSGSILSNAIPTSETRLKATIPTPLPKPQASSPKTSNRVVLEKKAISTDLLGLSFPDVTPTTVPVDNSAKSIADEFGNGDIFSNFLSASPVSANTSITNSEPTKPAPTTGTTSLAQEEQDFFNQSSTSDFDKGGKLSKDSILALYATAPPPSMGQHLGATTNLPATSNTFNNAFTGIGQQQFAGQPGNMQYNNMNMTNNSSSFGGAFSYGGNTNNPTTMNGGHYQSAFQSQPLHQQAEFASFPPMQQQQQQHQRAAMMTPAAFPMQPFEAAARQIQPTTAASINHQFGNLNLENVWQ